MTDTIMYITNDRPAYRVLNVAGFFGPDDRLWEEGSVVYFDGEPNLEFEPLNDIAKTRMTEYVEKLDTLGRAAAEKYQRPYTGVPRSFDGQLQFATANQRAEMAIMSAKKDSSSIAQVETEEVPETGNPKRGRGRPRKVSDAT